MKDEEQTLKVSLFNSRLDKPDYPARRDEGWRKKPLGFMIPQFLQFQSSVNKDVLPFPRLANALS